MSRSFPSSTADLTRESLAEVNRVDAAEIGASEPEMIRIGATVVRGRNGRFSIGDREPAPPQADVSVRWTVATRIRYSDPIVRSGFPVPAPEKLAPESAGGVGGSRHLPGFQLQAS